MNPIKNRLVDTRRWKPGALVQDNGGVIYRGIVSGVLVSCAMMREVRETDALFNRLLARMKR